MGRQYGAVEGNVSMAAETGWYPRREWCNGANQATAALNTVELLPLRSSCIVQRQAGAGKAKDTASALS